MIPRSLRLALAPIRSAIVLARFVFLKTTSKTPFLILRAFRSSPLAAPGAILEVESAQKVRHTYCFSAATRFVALKKEKR